MPSLFMQSDSDQLAGMYPPKADGTPRGKGLIQIESFSHSFDLPVSPLRTSFSNAAFHTGLIEHGAITVNRVSDVSSGKLINAFLNRTVVPYLQIISGMMTTVPAVGQAPPTAMVMPVWLLRMADVLFTEFSYESGDDGTVIEKFGIQYSSICWIIYQVNSKGVIGGSTVIGVDKTNTIVEAVAGDFVDANFKCDFSTAVAPPLTQLAPADYFNAAKWN